MMLTKTNKDVLPYLCIVSFNVRPEIAQGIPQLDLLSFQRAYCSPLGVSKGYVHCIFNRTKQYAVSMFFLFAASFWICFCYRCWCCCCLLFLRLDVAPKQPPVVPKLRALFAFKVLNSIQGFSWISLRMVSKSFGADYSGAVPKKRQSKPS